MKNEKVFQNLELDFKIQDNLYFYFDRYFAQVGMVNRKKCQTSTLKSDKCTSCQKDDLLFYNDTCEYKNYCKSPDYVEYEGKCVCDNNKVYDFQTRKCVSHCQENTVNYNGICSECLIDNCLKCENNSPFNCYLCNEDYYSLFNQNCVKKCPNGFSKITNQYDQRLCMLKCENEQFQLHSQCVDECPLGYYNQFKLQLCQECNSNCETCENFDNYCTSCSESQNLHLFYNKCVKECPYEGFYLDYLTNSCEKCNDVHCIVCSSANVCKICEDGYIFENNQCEEI